MNEESPEIIDEHLDGSYSFPGACEGSALPDLFVSLTVTPETTVPSPGASHSAQRRLPDSEWEPQTLTEWLRNAIARYLHREGLEVCHPWLGHGGDADDIDWRILPDGYHKPGVCAAEDDPCLLHEVWGGPDHVGQLHRHPITFAASPLEPAEGGVALDGVWQLTLRQLRPEYVGLLAAAIASAPTTTESVALDLGDRHTLRVDIEDAYVINPLYSATEVQTAVTSSTVAGRMSSKRIFWIEEVRDGFTQALSERLTSNQARIHDT